MSESKSLEEDLIQASFRQDKLRNRMREIENKRRAEAALRLLKYIEEFAENGIRITYDLRDFKIIDLFNDEVCGQSHNLIEAIEQLPE